MRASSPARSLKARALQWLSQREHSRAELRRKLLPHALAVDALAGEVALGASADLGAGAASGVRAEAGVEFEAERGEFGAAGRVEAVLDWLEAHRYLSNERFVESRVHARASRFGNLRIRQELGQHQLALSPASSQALRDSEFARASEVRERKFAAWPANPAERARQARFLAGRGFSPEIIGRLLRRAAGRHEEDASDQEI